MCFMQWLKSILVWFRNDGLTKKVFYLSIKARTFTKPHFYCFQWMEPDADMNFPIIKQGYENSIQYLKNIGGFKVQRNSQTE